MNTASPKTKSVRWDSATILGSISHQDLCVTDQQLDQVDDIIWGDLCSEYDAKNFCQYLHQRDISFTSEFEAFEQIWRRDELNHYTGFRQIYSLLYNKNPEEIDQEMAIRKPDFTAIQEFVRDEFSICVLIAYDELATARSYTQDFRLYKSFGPRSLANWIKYVTRDEGLHYDNALRVIAQRHKHRLSELTQLVGHLVEYNVEDNHQYNATFVLNHEQSQYFTPDFLHECGDTLCQRFGL